MEKNPRSVYKVRFSDCDLFGHLNNARYIDYFLNAREDHLIDHYNIELKTFYAQGISWLVGSHEILYRKPALYSETVSIFSLLLRALPDSLLVEMVMMDEKETQLKSILWTTFIPVNVKTGKRENHPDSFMEFASGIENRDISLEGGIRGREAALRQLQGTLSSK
jgi:YbgC/YbaW family acyl-CoA thioester hydrolase